MNQLSEYKTFTPEEVADIYQVSKANIYKMIQDGRLLAKKINERQYRIPKSEISWTITGLDSDIERMENEDKKVLTDDVKKLLKDARRNVKNLL